MRLRSGGNPLKCLPATRPHTDYPAAPPNLLRRLLACQVHLVSPMSHCSVPHFQRAGFTQIHTEQLTVTRKYISPEIFIEERRLATSANIRLLLADASEAERAEIVGAIKEELQTYKEV